MRRLIYRICPHGRLPATILQTQFQHCEATGKVLSVELT
jgi:hypothetical protein